jgi:uroporphyrinogen decarboxylase
MKPRDRILAVLDGEEPDRVPILPVVDGYHAPKVLRVQNWECFLDKRKMLDALLAALRFYGYDGVIGELALGRDPTVLGCKTEIKGRDVPLIVEPLIKEPRDIDLVEVPDPWSEGKMAVIEGLINRVGEEHFVLGVLRAPFETACILRGYMNFLGDIYERPGFVLKLIKASGEITSEMGKAMIEAGVDALVLRDSLASSSVISPEHYSKFAFPHEKKAIREFKEVPVILHICRDALPIIQRMAETGARILEVDSPVDLKAARELVGDKVVLKGNIDSVEVLERGTEEDVRTAVRGCMEAAKEGRGYILSSGDSIPRNAPPENVVAMVKAGIRYGGY